MIDKFECFKKQFIKNYLKHVLKLKLVTIKIYIINSLIVYLFLFYNLVKLNNLFCNFFKN